MFLLGAALTVAQPPQAKVPGQLLAPEVAPTPLAKQNGGKKETNGKANGNGNGEKNGNGDKKEDEEEKKEPDVWFIMRSLKGTNLGQRWEDKRFSVSGWTTMSYTASTTDNSNQPVVWNDRANRFLLQQNWLRLERSVLTEGTVCPTFGYRIDILAGSDYRFTLPRGLWNSQLENSDGSQNLYGVDPIQFYVNGYFPNLFKGTEIRIGRLYCPFGAESLEAVTTPLMSRSYAFNWCPPFTHMAIGVHPTFSDEWSGAFMLTNGNDVFFDNSQEMRFAGSITYKGKKNTMSFGTSIGRGTMNTGEPYNPATVSLMTEPAGRNNINVFDFVWNHVFNDCFNYTFEAIYGYQNSVPANVPGGIISTGATSGTAHWGSLVNYFNYKISDKWGSVARVEFFDDFEGQRTGFEGLYTAFTWGLQYKPRPGLIIRPEIRYDYNCDGPAFEGSRSIWTGGLDVTFRW